MSAGAAAVEPIHGPTRHTGGLPGALGRLRQVEHLRDLAERAVQGACDGCGLDGAALFRVDGRRMLGEAVWSAGNRDCAPTLDRLRDAPIPLDHTLPEAELVRRRVATVVHPGPPGVRPAGAIGELTGGRPYVAAPIMPEGHVVGVLLGWADGRDVGPDDRDHLWTFAEGVGSALACVVLRRRLAAQDQHLERLLRPLADGLRTARTSAITFGGSDTDTVVALRPQGLDGTADHRLLSVLTPREVEVLELVAAGETNGGIADRLVISRGTVKTHVSQLLRKLRVTNRAEAVSRYHRIIAAAERSA